jgi:hypothetical protein
MAEVSATESGYRAKMPACSLTDVSDRELDDWNEHEERGQEEQNQDGLCEGWNCQISLPFENMDDSFCQICDSE